MAAAGATHTSFADLDRVARIVAAQSRGLEFDDVKQTIWEKFLRYPPQSLSGAWTMAKHARNNLWRNERRRMHASIDGITQADTPRYTIDGQLEAREVLRHFNKKKLRWLLAYIEQLHPVPRDAVRVHRYRKLLREQALIVRQCDVPECGRRDVAKGYCKSHYMKHYRKRLRQCVGG